MVTPNSNDDLIIRRMILEDLDSVMYVEHRAYEFGWTRSTFRSCLTNGNECWVLARMDESGIPCTVGHSVFAKVVDQAELLNLAIDPNCQGQGLGSLMLDHVLHRMRLTAIRRVFLEVRKSNTLAQDLYTRRGFDRVGLRRDYYPTKGGREDALVLAMQLHD